MIEISSEGAKSALTIALLGYPLAGVAIVALWKALKAATEREAKALRDVNAAYREGTEVDKSYTAQLDSMAVVQSAMQRTTAEGFSEVKDLIRDEANRIIQETRP